MPLFTARVVIEKAYELEFEAASLKEAEAWAETAFYNNDNWEEEWIPVDSEVHWDGVSEDES